MKNTSTKHDDRQMKSAPPNDPRAKMKAIINHIATDVVHLETLATRKSDSLDFHDLAVWQIKAAREAAHMAGARDAVAKSR